MKSNNIEQLGQVEQNEINHKWPSILATIVDVLKAELERQGEKSDKIAQAKGLTFAIAQYFGGSSFYLPTGLHLKNALRNIEIYHRFTGNNVRELTKEFNLSESHIYAILREQRKLQKERNDKNPKFN